MKNSYDFMIIMDVKNGNPNGDPDAGNWPRMNHANKGLISGACIKRKIRNAISYRYNNVAPYSIYITENAVLETLNKEAMEAVNISKDKKPKGKDLQKVQEYMAAKYYDVRTFGAVMISPGNADLGGIRGPVQIGFAESVDEIAPLTISLTRMAETSEKTAETKDRNQTFGKQHIVQYGLYVCEGHINAMPANKTGFSDSDTEILWEAIQTMFNFDRSATRGEMTLRKLIIFKHESPYGNVNANKLFELIKISKLVEDDPQSFNDYKIEIDPDNELLNYTGVELIVIS